MIFFCQNLWCSECPSFSEQIQTVIDICQRALVFATSMSKCSTCSYPVAVSEICGMSLYDKLHQHQRWEERDKWIPRAIPRGFASRRLSSCFFMERVDKIADDWAIV